MNDQTSKQKLRGKFVESIRFICFVARNFISDDCPYRASALAFTTLLAIVPLMAVGFAVLSSFPVFHNLTLQEQNFIFNNFVPATGAVIQTHLQLFVAQVSKLSIIGVIALFIIALLVMFTIERAMNTIWRVNTHRQGISAFLLYWAILSLAPVLLGLSFTASSYFFSIPFIKGHTIPSFLLQMIPGALSMIGFTFLYVVVPNCRVRLLHGIYGAFVAALLFELAKQAFATYLTHYNFYQLLYGAFATIPILFIWVYWMWVITLLGAEISYAFSVDHQRRQGKKIDGYSHALLWLYHLWLAQLDGKSVTLESLINASNQPFTVDVHQMLQQLCALDLIKTTTDGHYLLSRDLTHLTLYDFMQLLPYHPPIGKDLVAIDTIAPQWHTYFEQVNRALRHALAINLDALFRLRHPA